MMAGPILAELAALIGDPARATMLSALLDGRALTAGELAYAARVTPQTASAHLARLAEAKLLAVVNAGRHRYFRLATPKVAQMIEGMMAMAIEDRPRFRPLSREAARLQAARLCYDHFAGRLGVALADRLAATGHVVLDDEGGQVTDDGARFLAGFGIDLAGAARRRRFCRPCLDWTERRPHIGGAVGAALAARCFDLGWTTRVKESRAVLVTPAGRRGLLETFAVALDGERERIAS